LRAHRRIGDGLPLGIGDLHAHVVAKSGGVQEDAHFKGVLSGIIAYVRHHTQVLMRTAGTGSSHTVCQIPVVQK
jgi:hypothetical protein